MRASLSSGRKLARYQIHSQIGAGGMGEVYLAEDTSLGRRIALKVLPHFMSSDREHLARFKREARALASLNHANIVTIHSIEEAEGINFLTMELVEGNSLNRLISEEGMVLLRFFELAVQISGAIAAAHEKGITHRDLKPTNIMVTDDGRVKILDFGLAKLTGAADNPEASTRMQLSADGMVLGTAPYMAPEQVQGKPVDQRTDVFALGVMFYEMLTGSRPFHGENSALLMSAILRDWTGIGSKVLA